MNYVLYALTAVMVFALMVLAVEEMRKIYLSRIDDGNDEL